MKNYLLRISLAFSFVGLISVFSWAQSPPAVAENSVEGVNIKINYHSPQVKGRIIWGGLEAYDKVWRTGANNATTIEVSENVKIGKNKMPKGKYSLFSIPKKGDTWTVIINTVPDQWGAYDYDEKTDLFRFDVKVDRTVDIAESLKFDVDADSNVIFAWEYRTFKFKIDQ